MARFPRGRALLVFYAAVRRSNIWRSSVHRLFKFGLDGSPAQLENRLTSPLKPASEKRYMVSMHPHGILLDGWHIVIAKNPDAFLPESNNLCGIQNFKMFLAFSPVIQYVPGHQELYRERCGGSSSKDIDTILRTTDYMPTICPGGFSEAIYAWSDKNVEYSWLDSNTGFIAVAIRNKTDIVPTYSYGLTSMYRTNTLFRRQLAELAQKAQFPLVFFWGKFWAYPLHERVTIVVYDPFPVHKYTLADVDQALADYQQYLKQCFDSDKGKYGMADKELVFIGPRKKQPVRSRL